MAETEKKAKKAKKEEKAEEKEGSPWLYLGAAVIAIMAIAAIFYLSSSGLSGVTFSSFKQNFNSAPRVAIVVNYYNQSIYAYQTICSTDLVEILASHRNPSTIDFFTIQNNTCTYIPNGIGRPANVLTNSSSFCLAKASSEPSITLDYGSANSTQITPEHLTIYGDSTYFRGCPIAVEIS